MASSSRKSAKGRGWTFSGKGGSSVAGKAAAPKGSEDHSDSSSSDLGSPETLGDILGQPTIDPWYKSGERFPSVPASLQPSPAGWEWLVIREDTAANVAWTPNFREIRDLHIQRNEMLAMPLVFYFQLVCSAPFLFQGVRTCSGTPRHYEDIENHWLLPILGDQDPAELELSPEESKIEATLADYIGRKNIALGTQAARFNPWMEHFNRMENLLIRRAAFVAYWLSKCIFGEHPAYLIKPSYFPLAVKIAAGVCFPLAPLLLGQLYTQLDLLHAEELVGESCHIVATAFNSSIVHTFLWEHVLEYITKDRKPYEARKKFASILEGVAAHVGDFQEDVPAVFCWVGSKFYDHSLIPSLDSESKVCWRPYEVTHRGFSYESVMSGFRNVEAQDYTLIARDMRSLTYLSATNAGWLPVLSSGRLQFTAYSAHRVRRQFGFDQEIPSVMGIAAGEIPTINPFLRNRAFAYWSGIAPRVIIPNGNRVGIYTAGMVNYWRELMAAMVEFRNSGRGNISHLLESYTSPLPHPFLFVATNTMTTYANRQRLGYTAWYHEESQWMIYGNHHPPLWLRDHPHTATPRKVSSSKGRRTASASTPAAKEKQSSKSKKREAPSKDSPAQASKKKKTSATKGGKEVLVLKTAVQDPSPVGESTAQGVSAPTSEKPVRKTRAGKKTFVPPAFPSAPSSIAARVAARKSTRNVVYSEKRSKQRADAVGRVPIEILDDLSSSSSFSSDEGDPSGAAVERTESENAEITAAETVSGTGTEEDEVSMDELEAADVAFDSASTVSASKSRSAEGTVEEHTTIGVVTSAERVVKTTPITIATSGETAQDHPSESGNHVDPSLLDSSPSTRHYVRRARKGSIVSTNSERTISATVKVSTPPSPLHESGSTAPTPVVMATVVPTAVTVQDSEAIPAVAEEVPDDEEVHVHTPDAPEDNNIFDIISINKNLVIGTDSGIGVTQVEHAEVAASEDPTQTDVAPGSGIPVIEETLAQDPVDDIDMADTHDSYDEVLVETEDHVAGAQAADMEVTAPVAAHASPTETAESGNEAVAEEDRRYQTAAMESATRGQPGLLSATRSATLGASVLVDMDAFFREFDRTSFNSHHAEHFWIFDDVKADFEIFRVPQGGIQFLKALWEKYYRSHILEWKAVVQEAIEGGFRFGFILDYLRRLAHDIFSRRILTKLRAAEAHVVALRGALNMVAPNPWDLASARRVSAESHAESALHGLLA
uniref:Aminotransferase-like plant mobile domain-containing protein n=1 Tax=Fagus sylvatica TaxID=28930 RepID=A0A2N9FBL7_FAGSY